MRSRIVTVKTAVKRVFKLYMMPGPSTLRTAFRSLLDRAMRSARRIGTVKRRREALELGVEIIPEIELDGSGEADQNTPHQKTKRALSQVEEEYERSVEEQFLMADPHCQVVDCRA